MWKKQNVCRALAGLEWTRLMSGRNKSQTFNLSLCTEKRSHKVKKSESHHCVFAAALPKSDCDVLLFSRLRDYIYFPVCVCKKSQMVWFWALKKKKKQEGIKKEKNRDII